jgi:hypothetical protein
MQKLLLISISYSQYGMAHFLLLCGPNIPLLRLKASSSWQGNNFGEFKVYYRNHLTRCMVYLGTVTERRKKERGNNLGDLLKKAKAEYSKDVPDPSRIFLLGP